MKKSFSVSCYVRALGADGEPNVLLVRHKKVGLYVPIGGRIEPNESPLEAVQRELREEIQRDVRFVYGMRGDLGVPRGMISYEEHEAGEGRWHMNFAFVGDLQERTIGSCDEWDRAIWVRDAPLSSPKNVKALVTMALRLPWHAFPDEPAPAGTQQATPRQA